MEKPTLAAVIAQKYGKQPVKIQRIGGGFYADVYSVSFADGVPIVAKVYKTDNVMSAETEQLALLRQYACVPMPEILWSYNADSAFPSDVMAMNCLPGANGGSVFYINPRKRARLAEQVVNNLLCFHNTENPNGFGEIGSKIYYNTFNDYYLAKAKSILTMADELFQKQLLPETVYHTAQQAVQSFNSVFYLPITKSALIHGDYNMWNILVDKKACTVTACIDPFGCMWADSELDLYQLNNANGKHFRLLETYAEKKPLSENFPQKCAFYELFTEIEHYYRSGHTVDKRKITAVANALAKFL